jgi:cell division protein FtsB
MTQGRDSHEQKTEDERREYYQTTIRPQISPTVEAREVPEDSTEIVTRDRSETGISSSTAKRQEPSGIQKFFREKWAESILFVALIWLGRELYSHNRELGELHRRLDDATRRQEQVEKDLEKLDERLQKELDRVDAKLEALRRPQQVKPELK